MKQLKKQIASLNNKLKYLTSRVKALENTDTIVIKPKDSDKKKGNNSSSDDITKSELELENAGNDGSSHDSEDDW